jgi:hypothetical protein
MCAIQRLSGAIPGRLLHDPSSVVREYARFPGHVRDSHILGFHEPCAAGMPLRAGLPERNLRRMPACASDVRWRLRERANRSEKLWDVRHGLFCGARVSGRGLRLPCGEDGVRGRLCGRDNRRCRLRRLPERLPNGGELPSRDLQLSRRRRAVRRILRQRTNRPEQLRRVPRALCKSCSVARDLRGWSLRHELTSSSFVDIGRTRSRRNPVLEIRFVLPDTIGGMTEDNSPGTQRLHQRHPAATERPIIVPWTGHRGSYAHRLEAKRSAPCAALGFRHPVY